MFQESFPLPLPAGARRAAEGNCIPRGLEHFESPLLPGDPPHWESTWFGKSCFGDLAAVSEARLWGDPAAKAETASGDWNVSWGASLGDDLVNLPPRQGNFGGEEEIAGSGLFTAKDPILFNGGDANLYGYVLNDPVNFVDSSGKNPIALFIAAYLTFEAGYATHQWFRAYRLLEQERMRSGLRGNRSRYYHCLATCEAARHSAVSGFLANLEGQAAECGQSNKEDVQKDLEANDLGSYLGLSGQDCATQCNLANQE